MQVVGGRGAGKQTELGYVGGLIGCTGDAQGEEFDALVLGVSDSRENVGVPRVGGTVCEQHGHFDAARARFLQVDPGHIRDGVGGVGAVPNVDNGSNVRLEVLYAPPIFEGLLCDYVTAVLQQSHPEAQAAAGLQPDTQQSVHNIHGKLLLLLMIVLGALRAVQQEGELQATVLIRDSCAQTDKTDKTDKTDFLLAKHSVVEHYYYYYYYYSHRPNIMYKKKCSTTMCYHPQFISCSL